MNQESTHDKSLSEVHGSIDTTNSSKKWTKIFSFLGPAYLVSVGYMDPGNWATDLAGGSKYGYSLIWVLLVSNLMALVLQSMSARLGIVRGRDLAQANRETFPQAVNFVFWIFAEIAIAATDLAEILGMAIGIQLLTGLPLLIGVSITVLDTFLLLYLQRLGMRKIEAFILVLIIVIGVCFLFNIIIANPSFYDIIKGFIPSLPNAADLYKQNGIISPMPKETALYISIGIIGATVMPHNLYLHSALVQTRKIVRSSKGIRQAIKWSIVDSAIALNIAFFINAAILILAATVFFKTGRTDIGDIKQAHQLLSPLLGSSIASILFAVALIASGQSSTITGTLAGQIVMEGYLSLRINPVVRRLITRLLAIIPAVLFIYYLGESKVISLLIFSQVILSIQLGFAIIPLIHFVSDKKTMGEFSIKPFIQIVAWIMASVLIFLNAHMVIDEISVYFNSSNNLSIKILIIFTCIGFTALLIYSIIYPLIRKRSDDSSIDMHSEAIGLQDINIPTYKKIAIALDFSKNDAILMSAAIGQASSEKEFILIHIVESPSAILHGDQTADYEAKKDAEQLSFLVNELLQKGFNARGILGYKERAKEIIRIVQEEEIDLLIIGAHKHEGIKDFIYGTTINKVRHKLKIPVLIVNP